VSADWRWRRRAIMTCPDMVPDAAITAGRQAVPPAQPVSDWRAAWISPTTFAAAQPAEPVSCERAAV
jgi:hypothetical protein